MKTRILAILTALTLAVDAAPVGSSAVKEGVTAVMRGATDSHEIDKKPDSLSRKRLHPEYGLIYEQLGGDYKRARPEFQHTPSPHEPPGSQEASHQNTVVNFESRDDSERNKDQKPNLFPEKLNLPRLVFDRQYHGGKWTKPDELRQAHQSLEIYRSSEERMRELAKLRNEFEGMRKAGPYFERENYLRFLNSRYLTHWLVTKYRGDPKKIQPHPDDDRFYPLHLKDEIRNLVGTHQRRIEQEEHAYRDQPGRLKHRIRREMEQRQVIFNAQVELRDFDQSREHTTPLSREEMARRVRDARSELSDLNTHIMEKGPIGDTNTQGDKYAMELLRHAEGILSSNFKQDPMQKIKQFAHFINTSEHSLQD